VIAKESHLPAYSSVIRKIQPSQTRQSRTEKASAPSEPQQSGGVGQRIAPRRRDVGKQKPPIRLQLLAPKAEQPRKFNRRQILDQRIDDDEIERGVGHGAQRSLVQNLDARLLPEACAQLFPHKGRRVIKQQPRALPRKPPGEKRLAATVIQHERIGRGNMRRKITRDTFVMQFPVAVAGMDRRVAVPEIEPAFRVVPPHRLSLGSSKRLSISK
jgi:hypothetical protein